MTNTLSKIYYNFNLACMKYIRLVEKTLIFKTNADSEIINILSGIYIFN